MIKLICDAKGIRQKNIRAKKKNCKEYTMSGKHYPYVAFTTRNNRWNYKKNIIRRESLSKYLQQFVEIIISSTRHKHEENYIQQQTELQ